MKSQQLIYYTRKGKTTLRLMLKITGNWNVFLIIMIVLIMFIIWQQNTAAGTEKKTMKISGKPTSCEQNTFSFYLLKSTAIILRLWVKMWWKKIQSVTHIRWTELQNEMRINVYEFCTMSLHDETESWWSGIVIDKTDNICTYALSTILHNNSWAWLVPCKTRINKRRWPRSACNVLTLENLILKVSYI